MYATIDCKLHFLNAVISISFLLPIDAFPCIEIIFYKYCIIALKQDYERIFCINHINIAYYISHYLSDLIISHSEIIRVV